jgi:hypothetical protein
MRSHGIEEVNESEYQKRAKNIKLFQSFFKESLNKSRKLRQWHFLTTFQYAMTPPSSFADLDYSHKKCRTRREVFLSEMEGVIPWQMLLSHIESHYPKTARRGRQPMAALERDLCTATIRDQ